MPKQTGTRLRGARFSLLLLIVTHSGCHTGSRPFHVILDEKGLHANLGKQIVLVGTADYDWMAGGVVVTDDGQRVLLENRVKWDEKIVGRRVSVRGVVTYVSSGGSPIAQGIFGVYALDPIAEVVFDTDRRSGAQ